MDLHTCLAIKAANISNVFEVYQSMKLEFTFCVNIVFYICGCEF